jgi:hypothetical protein
LEKNHIIQKHYWKNNLTNLTRHVQFAQLHTIAPVKAPFLAHFLSSLGAPTFGLLAFSGGLFVPVLCDPKHLKISQAIEDNKMHKNAKKKNRSRRMICFKSCASAGLLGRFGFKSSKRCNGRRETCMGEQVAASIDTDCDYLLIK